MASPPRDSSSRDDPFDSDVTDSPGSPRPFRDGTGVGRRAFRIRRPALFALIVGYLFLLLIRSTVWDGTGSDEILYYSQTTSPLWDGDINLANDVAESRNDPDFRLSMAEGIFFKGRENVPFAYGMPLLDTPLSAAFFAVDSLTGFQLSGHNRYAYFHRAAVSLATWIFCLLGLVACQRVAVRFCRPWLATALTLLLFLGTNLCYYVWQSPLMSHADSFAAVAVVLWCAVRYAEHPSRTRALWAGLCVGIAFLVRWQDIGSFALVFAAWISALAQRRHTNRKKALIDLALMIGTAAVAMVPQLLIWRRLEGAWLVVPQGNEYLVWNPWRIVSVLFSPLNGWIVSHPLVGLYLIAFPFLIARRRWLGLGALLVLVFGVAVSSTPQDWWGSGTFGSRRVVSLLPLLIPGAAIAAEPLMRNRRRASAVVLRVAVGTFAVFFLIANLVVVMRVGYEGPSPAFWWMGAGAWKLTLSLPFRHIDHVLRSDLFVLPVHSHRAIEVRGTFLAGWLLVVVVGGAVVWWFGSARRVVKSWISRGIPALVLAGGLTMGILWSVLPIPDAKSLGVWGKTDLQLRIQGDADDLSQRARDLLAESPQPPLVRLRALKAFLEDGNYEKADELTKGLQGDLPVTSAELWVDTPPVSSPFRGHWIQHSLAVRDPSDSFMGRLYGQLCDDGDGKGARAVSLRMGGPAWEREMRRGELALAEGEKDHRVARYFRTAARENPFQTVSAIAYLRFVEPGSLEARSVFRTAVDATAAPLALATLVQRLHPDLLDSFEKYWRPAFSERMQLFEWKNDLEGMKKTLDDAHAVVVLPGSIERLERMVHRAELERRRLAGESDIPYPDEDRQLAEPDFPAEATATCSPRWLRRDEGWGELESDADGTATWRWSDKPNSWVRLNHALPPGNYVLHIHGVRHGPWDSTVRLPVEIRGERPRFYADLPAHEFHLRIGIRLAHEHKEPMLRLYCPIVPIRSYNPDSGDPRWVGFLCYGVWIESPQERKFTDVKIP